MQPVVIRTAPSPRSVISGRTARSALRPDFTGEDLVFLFGANALLSRAAKDAAPLTPQQVYEVMGNLAGPE